MKQFVVDHLVTEAQKTQRVRSFVVPTQPAVAMSQAQPEGDDQTTPLHDVDLVIELDNGKRIGVYVINRAIRVPEIRERLEDNTRQGLHTLFILDGRMMPDDQEQIDPPHWMSALHALAQGRVYAYWCDRRAVTIRPVHLEWKWGDQPRAVAYGPAVEVGNLRTEAVQLGTKYLAGRFAAADFGEGAFWKQRDPQEHQAYKYNWRTWSFGGRKRATNGERVEYEQEPAYDPWEEFEQHYGHVGGFSQYRNFRYTDANDPSRARTRPRVPNSPHYAVLGVPTTATFDEVKQAYRRKARENHPDLHPAEREKYTTRMAEINAAFEAISKEKNKG
jgi:hypothetical protein